MAARCCALAVVFLALSPHPARSLSMRSDLFQSLPDAGPQRLRAVASAMFRRAYDAYLSHAFPHDELRPVTCSGADPFGSYAATLVDALDALVVLGEEAEFERACSLVLERVRFDADRNVSVFETNIRVVGGLLSAHLLAVDRGLLEPAAREGLLALAREVADRLLPAFDTPTGIPYGTVNLRHGVPPGETPVTSLAGAGTFALEFGALSRLTGDWAYERAARRAARALWARRSEHGLLGNHVDSGTGRWVAQDALIGAAGDSFYEYMFKAGLYFNDGEYQAIFEGAYAAVLAKLRKGAWYLPASMRTGATTGSAHDSLACFWPGLQVLAGHVVDAAGTFQAYMGLWNLYGAMPEHWNLATRRVSSPAYPLRPELAESCFYLSTVFPEERHVHAFQGMCRDIIEAIEHFCSAKCGYASLLDVRNHAQDNQMHSYFLAETAKYLYLLYDEDNFVRKGNYIFTTEGHVFPMRYDFMVNSKPAVMLQCPVDGMFKQEQAPQPESGADATASAEPSGPAPEAQQEQAVEAEPTKLNDSGATETGQEQPHVTAEQQQQEQQQQ
eukprot:m51a1_g38 hypothetical protein (558) ;mRNA; f:142077-143803